MPGCRCAMRRTYCYQLYLTFLATVSCGKQNRDMDRIPCPQTHSKVRKRIVPVRRHPRHQFLGVSILTFSTSLTPWYAFAIRRLTQPWQPIFLRSCTPKMVKKLSSLRKTLCCSPGPEQRSFLCYSYTLCGLRHPCAMLLLIASSS
jgi:hypothetical protein